MFREQHVKQITERQKGFQGTAIWIIDNFELAVKICNNEKLTADEKERFTKKVKRKAHIRLYSLWR